jgi:hypothetical protein
VHNVPVANAEKLSLSLLKEERNERARFSRRYRFTFWSGGDGVNITEAIRQKMDEAKAEYFRVVDLYHNRKASHERIAYQQGIYDGLWLAWRECVIAEIDAKSEEVTE